MAARKYRASGAAIEVVHISHDLSQELNAFVQADVVDVIVTCKIAPCGSGLLQDKRQTDVSVVQCPLLRVLVLDIQDRVGVLNGQLVQYAHAVPVGVVQQSQAPLRV